MFESHKNDSNTVKERFICDFRNGVDEIISNDLQFRLKSLLDDTFEYIELAYSYVKVLKGN